MLVKVVYKDGSTGMVRPVRLVSLLEAGEIVGFQGTEGWVEIRREMAEENENGYHGPERRKPE